MRTRFSRQDRPGFGPYRVRAGAVALSLGVGLSLGVALLATGCGKRAESIKVDGSSTVYPISEAVAEAFREVRPDVRVTVGLSGTGGGMKKLIAGEIDVCDASRGIKPSELEACEAAGVEPIELSVAFDGIAIVVNPENDWVECLTVEQLASVWRPDEPVNKWSELNPDWPDEKIKLYGPGTDSGTFDYFTEAVVGEEKACRADFTASEDDNVLVKGVSEDKNALGYFGFAYYQENAERIRVVPIAEQEGADCVTPTLETIRSDTYRPLSRPLFIYACKSTLASPDGAAFVSFYLENAGELSQEVGYVPVSDEVAAENAKRLAAAEPAG